MYNVWDDGLGPMGHANFNFQKRTPFFWPLIESSLIYLKLIGQVPGPDWGLIFKVIGATELKRPSARCAFGSSWNLISNILDVVQEILTVDLYSPCVRWQTKNVIVWIFSLHHSGWNKTHQLLLFSGKIFDTVTIFFFLTEQTIF